MDQKLPVLAMAEALQTDFRATIEAFHAFADERPESEKWELINGDMVLNPTSTNWHQVIVGRLVHELHKARDVTGGAWQILPGIGTRLPDDPYNEPVPDVMIVPALAEPSNWTYVVSVIFEVLSPFSLRRDMVHKRNFYTRIDSLTHYVVLAQDRMEATVFARADDFEPRTLNTSDARLDLAPLAVSLSLADIYRDVPIG
jgi:Uma2 family endonuclease